MEKINIEWLKRIKNRHDTFERSTPIGSKQNECTQAIFIHRCFKFLNNKAFKLKIDGTIYYAFFTKSRWRTSGTEHYYNEYGVRKYLGYDSSEFLIGFYDEKFSRQEFKLHWNDIIRIEYEEIPIEKYYNIVNLFI